MPHTPKEFVGAVLEIVETDLRAHLVGRGCDATREKAPDAKAVLSVIQDRLDSLFPIQSDIYSKAEALNYVHELRGFRNRWAHSEPLNAEDATRAADTLARLCRVLRCPDVAALNLKKMVQISGTQALVLAAKRPASSTSDLVGFSVVNVVACGKNKLRSAAKAADLYVGPVFTNSLDEARREGLPFLIFSSKFGLVQPDEVLEPYDASLPSLSEPEKLALARMIQEQVAPLVTAGLRKILLLGGNDFLFFLQRALKDSGVRIEKHPKFLDVKRKVFR